MAATRIVHEMKLSYVHYFHTRKVKSVQCFTEMFETFVLMVAKRSSAKMLYF